MQEQPIFRYFRDGQLPRLTMTHIITAEHSAEHARLVHLHENELELFYVARGEGEYEVGGQTCRVQRGDMVICNAGVLHGEQPSAERKMLSYCITLTNVSLHGLPDNHLLPLEDYPVIPCGRLTKQINEIMRMLTIFSGDLDTLGPICDCLSCGVLLIMMEIAYNGVHPTITRRSDDAVAQRIRLFLDEHYSEPLTLDKISDSLRISTSYLSHLFKREYGEAPMQYLYKRRIGEAQTLLMDTELPIGEISDRLNYGSVNHFNTIFKKYVGMTPGQYRKSFRTMDFDGKTED